MTDKTPSTRDIFNNEDSNKTNNPHIDQIMSARLKRRGLLLGGMGAAATTLLGAGALSGCATASTAGAGGAAAASGVLDTLGFAAVPKSLADKVIVPAGYDVQVIYALGDPLKPGVTPFKNDGTDTDWDWRAGDHHDGMEYFGLDANGQPSANGTKRGLLAVNHEATTDQKLSSFFIHANGGTSTLPRPAAEVDKELSIHGLSVVEVQATAGGWSYLQASRYNRRITPTTEVMISGPAKGSEYLITKFSPDATRARGTLNNCGTGKTPWGTFVSGEENWFGYFHRDAKDDERRGKKDKQVAALIRYGRPAGAASRHGWESAGSEDKYVRWNNGAVAASSRADYRNEMNTFGYVVEMDAYDGSQLVRKRTGLGRFAHESVSFAKPVAGQPIVAYMGDDSRGEYMYKFVSAAKWNPADANASNRLAVGDKYLDKGTLYVASFKDDGTGQWIELSMNNPIVAANPDFEFKSDADIAIFTRLAADAVSATKMDRPEWGGVNPRTGDFYMSLTNNSNRTVDGDMGADAANPRVYSDMKNGKESKGNVNGHIIRVAQANPADTAFKWDIYLFAAEADADKSTVNLSNLTDENDMSAPDGLAFSAATGVCWIQTDDSAYTDKTNCMLLAGIPGKVGDGSKKTLRYKRPDGSEKRVDTYVGKSQSPDILKRFLVGPVDCEITGLCETPDGKAMFINIQHPGENTPMAEVGNPAKYTSQWPANAGYGAGKRPRSATIVITKKDGGVIGS
ncbi:PhoX family phosphatase [Curvibacter sp. CHRR-16]|uniref:PhoX family protein n=1 Tax=Curvibacter sp. CHRR-16 TaxID=2835872 RepID=UPI001BD94894|nr:PhoX family phosphatase [Curvibacter sp. CHRR-16]MBT0570825.1 PhoX family phosphatase [Curvibacter sp. CHRR-16]